MVEITAPTTPEELADWLTFHAADIPLAIHRAPGQVERTTLAELDEKEPAEAQRWRGFFRWRWEAEGWLPNLASVIVRKLEEAAPDGSGRWSRRLYIIPPGRPRA